VLEILGILDDELRAPAAGRRPAAESGRPS
jgi:hypothetical protein